MVTEDEAQAETLFLLALALVLRDYEREHPTFQLQSLTDDLASKLDRYSYLAPQGSSSAQQMLRLFRFLLWDVEETLYT